MDAEGFVERVRRHEMLATNLLRETETLRRSGRTRGLSELERQIREALQDLRAVSIVLDVWHGANPSAKQLERTIAPAEAAVRDAEHRLSFFRN
jgi:hypothetical protein